MNKGQVALILLGVALLAAGVARFVRLGHFTWTQAGLCVLFVPLSLLILLVVDYTLHHSWIGLVIVLAFILVTAVGSPSFCVGLGLALIGVMVTKWP